MRTLCVLLVAASIGVLGACGADGTAPQASLAGTYTLTTAAGAALPFIRPANGGTTLRLLGETLTINASGGYTRSGTEDIITSTDSTRTPYTVTGTYTRSADQFTFTDPDLGTGTATLTNPTLTVSVSGILFLYHRN